jgi:3-deoxy-D-manno-octulosonic-acid transferase
VKHVSVSGDTRFDRVHAISLQKKEVEGMDEFCRDSKVVLAGSTWPEDEKLLISFILENELNYKFIIAPHEVHKERIDRLTEQLGSGCLRYSTAAKEDLHKAHILVIDSIGILSSLYRYAYIAYIGGGFGAGIHNILEPAAFGVPVIFGPDYHRFREARELIARQGVFSVITSEDLKITMSRLGESQSEHDRASRVCSDYVILHKGATERIMKRIDK